MESPPTPDNGKTHHYQTWIHSRLLLERELFDVVREGIAMIAAGIVIIGLVSFIALLRLP